MSAGRSLLCRTTPRAQVARHGCATPGHLRASVQVRQSALLAAYPSMFVKAHSRGPARSGSRDYSPSAALEPRRRADSTTWQQDCWPHLHAGRSQQRRQARERRPQRWGRTTSQKLSQTCRSHHRQLRGCAKGSLLHC